MWREQDMLRSHFLKAQDFSASLGSWGSAEPSWQAKPGQVFLPGIHRHKQHLQRCEGSNGCQGERNFA